jgi:phosphoglycerate dehydrogenase-like enzyme
MPPKTKIVTFLGFPYEYQKSWFTSEHIPEYELVQIPPNSTDLDLCERIRGADARAPGQPYLSREILSAAEGVKLVQFVSVGYAPIDLHSATELGIPVANNPGINAIAVAEHAVMFILALRKWAAYAHSELIHGRKARLNVPPMFRTGELYGKTVGILGLGNIGMKVAERVHSFGAKILYYKRSRLSMEEEERLGVEYRPLDQLLEESDVITLHLPLSDETEGMLGREQLYKMKKGAFLINTARKQIVDEDALVEALRDEHLAGVAMDVALTDAEAEQLSKRFEGIKNVMFTPHIAGVAPEVGRRAVPQMRDNILRVLKNEEPLYVVNKKTQC